MLTDDIYYMQLVLDLARSTIRQTLPNPHVASIIVKDGKILGVGCHLKPGGPHAEIHALNQAGSEAHGATLYVNLEPCAHFGKTPPCVDAIINTGIKRVVIANIDENPLVAGAGIKKLENAGIAVATGILAKDGYKLNQVFFHNIRFRQPYVTLKVGMSLDGKIATKTNISQWITSPESRKDAHRYRTMHTAILVGVGTILKDNPSLTAHLLEGEQSNPVRIILDHNLRTPFQAKVIADNLVPTWICTTSNNEDLINKYQELGIRILQFSALDNVQVLTKLYEEGIYSLLVEGGEQVYASFIEVGAVNQIVSYISPQLIGSVSAKHFFAGNGFTDLTTNLKLELEQVEQLGNDVKLVYTHRF